MDYSWIQAFKDAYALTPQTDGYYTFQTPSEDEKVIARRNQLQSQAAQGFISQVFKLIMALI